MQPKNETEEKFSENNLGKSDVDYLSDLCASLEEQIKQDELAKEKKINSACKAKILLSKRTEEKNPEENSMDDKSCSKVREVS